MKKRVGQVVLVIALFVLAGAARAQVVFGVKGGVNFSSMSNSKESSSTTYSGLTRINIGVTAEFPITPEFSVEPALVYSEKGQSYVGAFSSYSSVKMKLSYLEIPVNAIYKKEVGTSAKIYGAVGPYVAFAIGGQYERVGRANTPNQNDPIKFGSDEDKGEIKGLDIGLNIGAGVEVEKFVAGFQYGLGFTNLSNSKDSSTSNRVFSISLGYKFKQ